MELRFRKLERNSFQLSVIWHEYRTNYGRADYLVATADGYDIKHENR